MVEGAPPEEKGIGVSTREDEKGRVERREEKQEEEIAELRSDASKESGAAIDDGLMGRSLTEVVVCIDGNISGGGQTCAEACGGDCCVDDVDDKACTSFTGSVARDGSCNGKWACRESKIDVVSGKSCVGE